MDAKRWGRIGLAVLVGWCATGLIDPDIGLASPSSAITRDDAPDSDSPVLLAKKKKKKKTTGSGQTASTTPESQATSSRQLGNTDTPAPIRPPTRPATHDGNPAFLEPVASGFTEPILVTHAGDNSNRLFVVEKGGLIKVIKNGQVLATPYLDLQNIVPPPPPPPGVHEQGLLSLAFHPNFASNGTFFVYYTDKTTIPGVEVGPDTLARYIVSNPSADVANVTSTTVLISQPDRGTNHNGGMIAFDRNPNPGQRLLYLSIGDEGGGGDPFENAQNLSSLFGKILRIDVNGTPDPGLNYKIPTSNPFFNTPSARKEIWAYGLRNPWRMSFDRATGDLYVGDVGQNAFEEIDFEPGSSSGGVNYGWDDMEGAHCFEPSSGCLTANRTLPVLEYPRSQGCSVTGGYVYRGATHAGNLGGTYFYSDYCTGVIWRTQKPPAGPWFTYVYSMTGQNVVSFGEDEAGEVYVVTLGGSIFRIDPGCSPRPNVQVTTVPNGSGGLTISLVSSTNASTPHNGLFSIRFIGRDNAEVGIGAVQNYTSADPVDLGLAAQASFTIRRPIPPMPGASTVRFVVTDGCGDWPSFAGGGAGSF
jgi:glucose/arabinose dehydrogenase